MKKWWVSLTGSKIGLVAAGLILFGGVAYSAYRYTTDSSPTRPTLMQREMERLEEAVQKYPNSLEARVQLADLYTAGQRYGEAKKLLEEALALEEENQEALIALGNLYIEEGRYQESLEPYAKVVELNEHNPMKGISRELEGVHYYMGVAYLNLANAPEAATHFREALAIDRTDADALYGLGSALQKQGEYDQAISSLLQAIRFVPNFEEAYRALVECYEALGLEGRASYAMAMVDYSTGLYTQAVDSLQSVVSQEPDFADAHVGLGLSLEKVGRQEEALQAYAKAVELDPDYWVAQRRLETLTSR